MLNLGDIVISHQLAQSQAIEYGHSLKREISFLFVHGLLHLLGYDHMNKNEEKQMFKLQDKILNSLGIRR
jgi:probable rRNA maturation factor